MTKFEAALWAIAYQVTFDAATLNAPKACLSLETTTKGGKPYGADMSVERGAYVIARTVGETTVELQPKAN